jgi:hypothetical protein
MAKKYSEEKQRQQKVYKRKVARRKDMVEKA